MTTAWFAVTTMFVIDLTWIVVAGIPVVLSPMLSSGIAASALALLVPVLNVASRRAVPIMPRYSVVARRFALFVQAFSLNAALALVTLTFCFLANSLAWPLKDAVLSQIDSTFGFDWTALLAATNSAPIVAKALTKAYDSSLPQFFGLFALLSILGHDERISETCAALAISTVVAVFISALVPAIGPYGFYRPAAELASNFGPGAGAWHLHLFEALRTAPAIAINFSREQGLVTFPSVHAVWAIITVYALRDFRWLFWPVAFLNAMVILSTMPEGGHYLSDVLGGVAIAVITIVFLRGGSGRFSEPLGGRPLTGIH